MNKLKPWKGPLSVLGRSIEIFGLPGVMEPAAIETVCGEPVTLSEMDREALRAPAADGLNVMLTEQLARGETEEQLLVCEKSPAFGPVNNIAPITSVTLPGLEIVIDCIVLLNPTG
jgi:hypothetical protein